ncbi:MAG: S8 family serine peptidase, partial [Gemmatimonadales bacterium]
VIAPRIEVTARDAQGNTATGFTGGVTVAIGINPSGGILSGTTTAAAVGGIASFSTLSIDQPGVGYTLTATAVGPAGATSAVFDVSASLVTQLVFTRQPSSATAGAVITPSVRVTARNSSGQTETSFTGNVTLTITAGTGTAGSTLSGATTMAAVAGVANFATLNIDNSGSGFRLSATASGLSGAVSAPFTINAGPPTRVTFSVQPASTTAAATIPGVSGGTVQATVRDVLGNPVKIFTGNVSVALLTNPSGGVLSGTTTVAAVAGIATFNNLSIDRSGNGYRLDVSSAGLASDTSDAISITGGAATQLLFTVQPSNTAANAPITPPIRVTALDALGNVATSFTGTVTLMIGTNPAGGTLTGTTAVAAVGGVATFSSPLSINNAGVGYRLTASAGGVTAATSALFNIN